MADKTLDLIPWQQWGFFTEPKPCVIAGPCSAETREQVLETAKGLKEIGINVFRAGIWKPRTHPGSFEGVGTEGLLWLKEVKQTLGMKVCTEVASEKHVYECLKHGIDMVWIGARTSANPFLMQEIADALQGCDIPVLVKNPVNPDMELWIGALERLNRAGIKKLGVIHRGFSSASKIIYRNDPSWGMAIELRAKFPELTFFVDPSHMGGDRVYIKPLSQKALDLGLDGLMVESHCNPACAWSDAKQQLTPAALIDMLTSITVREKDSENLSYKEHISNLRAQIDVTDECIMNLLATRMNICKEIGKVKKENNIAIVQGGRWDSILEQMTEKAHKADLSDDFVKAVWTAIHEESVRLQNAILTEE